MVALDRVFHCFRNGTARTQTIDFGRAESELPEKLITMFPMFGARFADTLAIACT
jgi:hypothetical protein